MYIHPYIYAYVYIYNLYTLYICIQAYIQMSDWSHAFAQLFTTMPKRSQCHSIPTSLRGEEIWNTCEVELWLIWSTVCCDFRVIGQRYNDSTISALVNWSWVAFCLFMFQLLRSNFGLQAITEKNNLKQANHAPEESFERTWIFWQKQTATNASKNTSPNKSNLQFGSIW